MNVKELFDVLDPETWNTRPLQKVFRFNAVDWKELSQEELRQVLFKKIHDWSNGKLHLIDTLAVEPFIDEETMAPCVQIRFTIKKEHPTG